MRLSPSFVLAAALFNLGSALPAEEAGLGFGRGPGINGPQLPSPGDLPGSDDGKGASVASQGDVELSADDQARFAITCDQRGWTYLYSWYPYVFPCLSLHALSRRRLVRFPPVAGDRRANDRRLMNEVCDSVGDKVSGDWLGVYPASHRYVGENKQIVFGWNITGPPDKCKHSCRQVFTALHNHAPCESCPCRAVTSSLANPPFPGIAEDFWMKEQAELVYEGCGMAWYNVEYTLGPMPDHGTLLCWDQPAVPSYTPDPLAVQRFCADAVFYIQQLGNEFLSLYERVGFFWTDYSRQVSRPEAPNTFFDTGFVHFWLKPTQYKNVCGPGENIFGQVDKLTAESCVKHIESIEKQQASCEFPPNLFHPLALLLRAIGPGSRLTIA